MVVLAADQASKCLGARTASTCPKCNGRSSLLPVLNLTFVRNTGVTFGLLTGFGQWGYLVLAAVALAVVAALGVWLRRAESPTGRGRHWAPSPAARSAT